jgi:hypothetical protein
MNLQRKDIMTPILRIAAAALFLSQLTASAYAQQPASAADPSANFAPAAQADSPEGLKALLGEILVAVKTNDTVKYSAYFSGLAFPDDGAWLLQEFGPTEGPRLKTKYAQLQSQAPDHLKKLFQYALQDNCTNVRVLVYGKENEPTLGVLRSALESTTKPIEIYVAYGNNPENEHGVALGNFVHVDGAFRFLNGLVLQALGSAPPARIRLGGSVALRKLLHKVDPIYPPEAQAAHIQGDGAAACDPRRGWRANNRRGGKRGPHTCELGDRGCTSVAIRADDTQRSPRRSRHRDRRRVQVTKIGRKLTSVCCSTLSAGASDMLKFSLP